MHVIYPSGALPVRLPARRNHSEANDVFTICKALDQAGYLFDQEVTVMQCRLDIVVYSELGAIAVIEVKRGKGGKVSDRQKAIYRKFSVPVYFVRGCDAKELLRHLAGSVGKFKNRFKLSDLTGRRGLARMLKEVN